MQSSNYKAKLRIKRHANDICHYVLRAAQIVILNIRR